MLSVDLREKFIHSSSEETSKKENLGDLSVGCRILIQIFYKQTDEVG
jgi:hypothetical protein